MFQKYRKMRRRQDEGMADAPHSPTVNVEYVRELIQLHSNERIV